MTTVNVLLGIIFILSVFFTWTNGFQHASAVAANALGSHSMTKGKAMVLIAICEFLGTMFGGSAVATVIASLSKWPKQPTILPLLASALLAAISWNFLARKLKMPASSTHALIGGVIGALVAGAGNFRFIEIGKADPVHPTGVIGAVISLFLSPLLGFAVAYVVFAIILILSLSATQKFERVLQKAQLFLTGALAFGDGQNDTQKTMGIVVLSLQAAGILHQQEIPIWLRLVIGIFMGLGAFSINNGLVKELAFGVYKLKSANACSAEIAGASVLVANSLIGGPVSASQVIAAGVMGAGAAERARGIHWLVIKDITLSWLVTIPANMLIAAGFYFVIFKWFQV